LNPTRTQTERQHPQRIFPPPARRPLVSHMRHAHASSAGTFTHTRTFVVDDEQGARLIREGRLMVWRGVETTPRAVAALTRHSATHAQARAEGKPTCEPVTAERRAA
jgi:hypothetical protein